MRRRVVDFLASSGYLGYAPIVPGTFGTLPALVLFPAFAVLASWSVVASLVAFVAVVAVAIWVAAEAEEIYEGHDNRRITIDEVAGYVASILFVSFSLEALVGSFVLFRVFDVVKPWPAGWVDRTIEGGSGVVLDDVVAGFYANATLRLGFWLVGWPI